MGYVKIADHEPQIDPDYSLELWLSADEVVGLDDDHDIRRGWDWIGDGYGVRRTNPGQHDGHPATVITLTDSDGDREVGRLVLRNDALRDARLRVTRQFQDPADKLTFKRLLTEGTEEVKTLELDVAYGNGPDDSDDFESTLADMLSVAPNTFARVVNPHGPGGGAPVVAFRGPDRELRRLLREKYGADGKQGESVSFYMGEED